MSLVKTYGNMDWQGAVENLKLENERLKIENNLLKSATNGDVKNAMEKLMDLTEELIAYAWPHSKNDYCSWCGAVNSDGDGVVHEPDSKCLVMSVLEACETLKGMVRYR